LSSVRNVLAFGKRILWFFPQSNELKVDGDAMGRYDGIYRWAGWAIADGESCLRKVRAPQSTVPGNTRPGRPGERATENDRRFGCGQQQLLLEGVEARFLPRHLVIQARVKRWCKRPPAPTVMPAAR